MGEAALRYVQNVEPRRATEGSPEAVPAGNRQPPFSQDGNTTTLLPGIAQSQVGPVVAVEHVAPSPKADGFWKQVWINVVSASIFAYFALMAGAFVLWLAQMDPIGRQPLRIVAYLLGSPILILLALRLMAGIGQVFVVSKDWFNRIILLLARSAALGLLAWGYVYVWMRIADALVTVLMK